MGDNSATKEEKSKPTDQKTESDSSLKPSNEKVKENVTDKDDKEKSADGQSGSGISLKPLRSVKSSENIAILEKSSRNSKERVEKEHEEIPEQTKSAADTETKVETFFEKPDLDEDNKSTEKIYSKSETSQQETNIKPQPSSDNTKTLGELPTDPPLPTNVDKTTAESANVERIARNQSDIFSLKEQTAMVPAIFSVNGSPSRKLFRRKEIMASNVFPFGETDKEEPSLEKLTMPREKVKHMKETYNDLARPSGSIRNPLTGTGLSSNDEYKVKGSKRKDGNPLLGLGYSPEATPSTHRIPPGGFSHKLW